MVICLLCFSYLSLKSQCNSPNYTLVCGAQFLDFDNNTPVNSTIPAPTCGNYSGNDIWFQTTLGDTENLVFELEAGSLTDMAMAIYSGNCNNPTLLACDDNSGNGNMPKIQLNSVAAGTTLWIRVWDENGDESGSFGLAGYLVNSTNCFTVNGDAQQTACNCYQLTPALNSKSGSVWNTRLINLSDTFDFDFEVYFGTNDGGADGISFILQPISTTVGGIGGGVGFTGINPSLGVIMDTYQNGEASDPAADHIALQKNGDVYHQTANNLSGPFNLPNIENGAYHKLRVSWYPGSNNLKAYFNGTLYIDHTEDIINTIFGGDPEVFWGFSGSTGGLNNDQRFCLDTKPEIFSSIDGGSGCEGDTIYFTDGTNYFDQGFTWNWDFGDGNNSTDPNPKHVYHQAGSYTVTLNIKDNLGCDDQVNITVLIEDAPEITLVQDTLTCEKESLNINATFSGASAYDFNWTGPGIVSGATAASPTVNQPGIYQVHARSQQNGCADSANVEILIDTVAVKANAGDDKIIFCENLSTQLMATTQNSDSVQLLWTGPGIMNSDSTSDIEVNQPGTYTLKVTTLTNGCESEDQVEVIKHPPITEVSFELEPTACEQENGSVTVLNVSGGTANYSYNFNNLGFSSITQYNNLGAGNYSLMVRDANGCTLDTSLTIENLAGVSDFSVDAEPGVCGAKGSLRVTAVEGGSEPYQYSINGGNFSSNQSFTFLDSAEHTIRVRDALGCTFSKTVLLQNFPDITIREDSVKDISCFGLNDGAIYSSISGHPPLSILWNNNPALNTEDADSLAPGNYFLLVRDTLGCEASMVANIQEPTALDVVYATTPSDCDQDNGTASANVSGGTPPYQYLWNSSPPQSTSTALNLAGGGNSYQITISDSNGCSVDTTLSVFTLNAPSMVVDSFRNVSCSDSLNGWIKVSSQGGTEPYQFRVNQGTASSNSFIADLDSGMYTIEVIDAAGCSNSLTQSISKPSGIVNSFTVKNDSCERSVGAISSNVSGGTAPYSYHWNTQPPSSDSEINQLDTGIYILTVTDNQGCTAIFQDTVEQTQAIQFNLPADTAFCEGDSVLIQNSFTGEHYLWMPTNDTTAEIYALEAGFYSLTITTDGCSHTDTIFIREDFIPPIDLGNDSTFCAQVDWNIDAFVDASTSYLWSTGSTNATEHFTQPGSYYLDLERGRCTASDTINISLQPGIIIQMPPDTNLCDGEEMHIQPQIMNVNTPSYTWSNGLSTPDARVNTSGNYQLIVQEGVCADTATIGVNFLEQPRVNIGADTNLCRGEQMEIRSNYQQFQHQWNDGTSGQSLITQNAGIYWLEVSNGKCLDRDSLLITVQDLPQFNLGPDFAICANRDSLIGISPNANQNYLWNTGETTSSIVAQHAGNYSLTVTEGRCQASDQLEIEHLNLPQANNQWFEKCPRDSMLIKVKCNDCVSYIWESGWMQANRMVYHAFSEYLTLTNQNNCERRILVEVRNSASRDCLPIFYVPSAFTPNDDGSNELFIPVFELPELLKKYKFSVLNRWGELLFSSTDPSLGWDGTYLGETVKPEQYVWTIEYELEGSSQSKRLIGRVALLN